MGKVELARIDRSGKTPRLVRGPLFEGDRGWGMRSNLEFWRILEARK